MSEIFSVGAIGVPANELPVKEEITEDDFLLGVNAPAGQWSLVVFPVQVVRSAVGGGGTGGVDGILDGGDAFSTFGGEPILDGGGA